MNRFLIIFLILFLGHFVDCRAQDITNNSLNQLSNLNSKLTLSNYSPEQRNNNLNLCDTAYALITLLSDNIDQHSDHLPEYLHLSYKLANCFQQNDRTVEGEIVLSLAFQILKKQFPEITVWPAAEACENLRQVHPILSSMYAAICHFSAKSYFTKPHSTDQFLSDSDINASEELLKRSLELRKVIDAHPELYQEPGDSGKELFYASHTVLFSRTLGYFYLEKGDFSSAKHLYENIFLNIDNLFEKVMASQQLVTIYSQLAHQEWDSKKAQVYYLEAYAKVKFIEDYLEHNNWSGSSTAYRILAEFYGDKTNPFYNLWKAKAFLEKPFTNSESISQERLAATGQKLGNLYEQLSHELMQQSSQMETHLQADYYAGKTSLLLNTTSSTRVQGLLDLARIYRHQKLFLQAELLLGNAASLSDQLNEELNKEIWNQLYLVEKEYLETFEDSIKRSENMLNSSAYRASIQRYQMALQNARRQFRKKLNPENCWSAHEELANRIKEIIESMFKETLSLLQPIHAPFAVIGLGSLAKDIMSPYSDVEYLMVHGDSLDRRDQESLQALSTLFLLRLIAIGETPCKQFQWGAPATIDLKGLEAYEGIRPDSGGIISHSFGGSYKMSGSISQLIDFSPHLALTMAYVKGKLLFGSDSLAQEFQGQVKQKLSEYSQDQKNSLIRRDLIAHSVPILHINENGERYFSPKHAFLRSLSLVLCRIAQHYGLWEQNPAIILERLEEKSVISHEDKVRVDTFLRHLLCLISNHYMNSSRQSMKIVVKNTQELESFLELTNCFYGSMDILSATLPFQTVFGQPLDSIKMRLRTLCRGGYMDLVKKELVMSAEKTEGHDMQWEIRGDVEMLSGKFNAAYSCYMKALEENPKDVFLHFKLAEASLHNLEYEVAKKHLAQAETGFEKSNGEAASLKVNYLKCLLARKQGDWARVSQIVSDLDTSKKYPILKPQNLLHGLIEIEKAHLQLHLGSPDKACEHLEAAEKLIVNRYGILHPFALPVYELLEMCLGPDKIGKIKQCREYIVSIKQLFPDNKWQGALDSRLWD